MSHYKFVSHKLTLCVMVAIVITLLPLPYIVSVFIKEPFSFPDFLQKPLILSFVNGLLLSVVTGIFALLWSVPAALLLSLYRIRFKKLWVSLLILPIAIPSYLSAYVYSDLLYYTSDLAMAYQAITGALLPFNIHSLVGGGFVLSLCLYPYIFFPLYLRLKHFSPSIFDYARTIGHRKLYIMIHSLLKSSMPVILFGLCLITLETLGDYGTVSYYGIKTPSLFLFDIWQQTGDITIAINITCLFLIVTGGIFTLSYYYQIRKNYNNTPSSLGIIHFKFKNKASSALAYGWFIGIIGLTLLIPIGFFLIHFIKLPLPEMTFLQNLAYNSFVPAVGASLLCVVMGVMFSYFHYHSHNKFLKSAIMICSSGYAFPGVILGICVYGVLLTLNRSYNTMFDSQISLVSGSIIGLVLCYYIKFLTVSYGCLSPVYKTINPSLFQSAITIGHRHITASRMIYWPFLKKPIIIGFILVLVDVIKELPITLLMRPFGFETFATHTYNMAALERIEEASVAALILIAMGIIAALIPITTHIIKDSNSENF
jgi:iron(III) transport system permease protein